MLFSLSLIFLLGMALASLCQKLKLPQLLGMLLAGMLLGPYALNAIHPSILLISPDLRKIALVIILIRAGLNLDIKDLVKAGRPAVLMCFVPACFEIVGMYFLAPYFLGVTKLEALIIGSVVAAVSPAVIVPKMISLMEKGYGTDKLIPQTIMAGASVDDVFVIVLFTVFTSLAQGGSVSFSSFMDIPLSIISGVLVGFACGKLLCLLFTKAHLRDSAKTVVFLSVAFILVSLEDFLKGRFAFSGLLAVMSCGLAIYSLQPILASRLSSKFSKLWVGAEVLLFALVGATVNLSLATKFGLKAVLLILGACVFRMLGVQLCMAGSSLSVKERLFCTIAYLPKATVQAAIGSVPLSMGLACGDIVLTVAVIAIMLSAPLGAFGIDLTYDKWLNKTN